MKRKKWIFTMTITGILILLVTSCKKKESNDNNYPPVLETGTVTDVDGNIYKTVKIGTQWWMAENLKVIHYRNGDIIPNISDSIAWSNTVYGARCFYKNDSVAYASIYGAMYNWYAVNDSRQISPLGWHVPSDADWTILLDYLGGLNIAGGKMKEAGITHWASPNSGATNSSGFTALPCGFRILQTEPYYYFDYLGFNGGFWSSTAVDGEFSICYGLYYGDETVIKGSGSVKKSGCSIRCIMD